MATNIVSKRLLIIFNNLVLPETPVFRLPHPDRNHHVWSAVFENLKFSPEPSPLILSWILSDGVVCPPSRSRCCRSIFPLVAICPLEDEKLFITVRDCRWREAPADPLSEEKQANWTSQQMDVSLPPAFPRSSHLPEQIAWVTTSSRWWWARRRLRGFQQASSSSLLGFNF